MTKARVRFVQFERGEIDPETGEFPMILASDGEASDGDILSIEGARFNSRAPLQLSHINDPTATLGSVSGFRRDLTSSPKRLKARGQIELTGEGANADIRRDIAHMIRNGHVTGISVSWEPVKWTRRTELPKDHPAYVREDEKDPRKRYGFFHETWNVREGSIVAIQADKAAMVGRADETSGDVAAFWRAMAETAKERSEIEAPPEPSEPQREDSEPAPAEEPTPRSAADSVREMVASGVALDDIEQAIDALRATQVHPDPQVVALQNHISTLTARLSALEEKRETAAPLPAINNVQDIFDQYQRKLDEAVKRVLAATQAAIDARRGKIGPSLDYRAQLHAEVQSILDSAAAEDASEAAKLRRLALGVASQLEVLVNAARERHETDARHEEAK